MVMRAAKRRKLSPSDDSEHELGEDRAAMLSLLSRQCAADLGLSVEPVEDEPVEDFSNEWTGIGVSDAVSEATDGEDSEEEQVVDFSQLNSRQKQTAAAIDYKAFMSSKIQRQLDPSSASSKDKPLTSKEQAIEKEYEKLDVSLQNLISTLPQPSRDADGFSALPKRQNYSIQKNTPIPLRRALQHSRLDRAKARAEQDRQSGSITAKVSHQQRYREEGAPALTKQGMRLDSGQEKHRRKNAKGIGGAVGRLSQSGHLRLTKEEIQRVQSMPSISASRKNSMPRRR